MKTDRIYEFKISEVVSPAEHIALLCKMLEAAVLSEKDLMVNKPIEFTADPAV